MYQLKFNNKNLLDCSSITDIQSTEGNKIVFTLQADYMTVRTLFTDKYALATIEVYEGEALVRIITDYTRLDSLTISPNTNGEDTIQVTVLEGDIADKVTALEEKTKQLDKQLNPELTIDAMELDELKAYRQDENKKALATFLQEHPIQYLDGKYYGVTEEDQNELSLNFMQYELAIKAGLDATLEWHAVHEKCTAWTVEELTALSLQIKAFVYPYLRQMQDIKEQIYACASKEELLDIVIAYTLMDKSPSIEEDENDTEKETGEENASANEANS